MADPDVGVVGLGKMGSVLARRIASAGYTVTGYDIDEEALEAAADRGIAPAQSVRDLVTGVDVILTSLPDPAAVRSVYLGDAGLLAAAEGDLLVIETSTIDPDTTAEIAAAADEVGVSLVDSPVSGGIGRAERGTLTVMVGGEPPVVEDERVQDVIGTFASDVIHGGPIGSGHTLKLINNLIGAATGAAALEGAVLAAEAGVDWEAFVEAVGTSSGSSYMFRKAVPRVLDRDFEATFTLDMGLKDTRLALDMADAADLPLPVSNAAYQLRMAGSKKGYGEEGSQAVVKVLEEFADGRVEHPAGIDEDVLSWEEKD